jgi:hypothetical protein
MKSKQLPFLLLAFTLMTAQISPAAPEHVGFRMEFMNMKLINLYGMGGYTHTERMDAEILVYLSTQFYNVPLLERNKDYISFFSTFAVKYRPIVTDWFNFYVGAGSFPFILRGYMFHTAVGVEFMQSDTFGIDLNLKYIFNKESTLFEWLPKGWALCLGIRT